MSGIFRDSFQNVVELLDDLFQVLEGICACHAWDGCLTKMLVSVCMLDVNHIRIPLLQRAANADEPPEMNFIRKHSSTMKDDGLTNPAARLFSNPAGMFCRQVC